MDTASPCWSRLPPPSTPSQPAFLSSLNRQNILWPPPPEMLLTHFVMVHLLTNFRPLFRGHLLREAPSHSPVLTWIPSSQYLPLANTELYKRVCLCTDCLSSSLEWKFHEGGNPALFAGISVATRSLFPVETQNFTREIGPWRLYASPNLLLTTNWGSSRSKALPNIRVDKQQDWS